MFVGRRVAAGPCGSEIQSVQSEVHVADATGDDHDEEDLVVEDASESSPRSGERKFADKSPVAAQDAAGSDQVNGQQEPEKQSPTPQKGWPSKRLVKGSTAFFVIKSFHMKDLKVSMQKGTWTTTSRIEKKLNAAFEVSSDDRPSMALFLLRPRRPAAHPIGIAGASGQPTNPVLASLLTYDHLLGTAVDRKTMPSSSSFLSMRAAAFRGTLR